MHPFGVVRQRGYTTLVISIILLVSMTFIALYAARVGLMEQQISANERRGAQAFQAAEQGVDQGIAYIKNNRDLITSTTAPGWMVASAKRWQSCSSEAFPCGDGTSVDTTVWGSAMLVYTNVGTTNAYDAGHIVIPTNPNGKPYYTLHFLTKDNGSGAPTTSPVIWVVAQGTSDDDTAQRVVRQAVNFYPFVTGKADAPMISATASGGAGTMSIVANPNGGGANLPLSVWTNENFTVGGSFETCELGEHLTTGTNKTLIELDSGEIVTLCSDCNCDKIAGSTNKIDNLTEKAQGPIAYDGIDILDVDSGAGFNPDSSYFPPDLFEYVFGTPAEYWKDIYEVAQKAASCGGLGQNSSGLWWITGDCTLNQGDIGSFENPILLVVEGKVVATGGNRQFFGLLFAYNPDNIGPRQFNVGGSSVFYGAIITDQNVDNPVGGFVLRYEGTVLQNLSIIPGGRGIAKVPGTWADY